MATTKKSRTIVGIAWYRPEQWDALKEFSEDRDKMDSTYAIWKKGAQKAIRQLRSRRQEAVAVDFDLEEFKMWCAANKKRPVAASRSEFAVLKLRESHKG
jgi:hypothetical protein